MKFSEHRQTLIKHAQTPDPGAVATPRWLTPFKHEGVPTPGWYIAKNLDLFGEIPAPVPNRAQKRARITSRPRMGRVVKRVSIPREHQPWKPAEKVLEPA